MATHWEKINYNVGIIMLSYNVILEGYKIIMLEL